MQHCRTGEGKQTMSIDVCMGNEPAAQPKWPIFRPSVGRPRFIRRAKVNRTLLAVAVAILTARAAVAVAESRDTVGLLKDLQATTPSVRLRAIDLLGERGQASPEVIGALTKFLAGEDVALATHSAYALGRIGPKAKDAVPALEKCADSSSLHLRTVSTWAMAKIEPKNESRQLDAASLLAAALGSKQPQVRQAAARGLADLKPSLGLVLPGVRNAMQIPDQQTAENAAEALASLGEPAVPELIVALKIERIRPTVAKLLGQFGPKAKQAIPALKKAADDPNRAVRDAAKKSLKAIER
jgi:HEAT repeat protein